MIPNLLSQLHPFAAVSLMLVLVVGIALTGQWAIGRIFPREERRAHNELFGHAAQIVGVINAVLLALIVFAVWTNYDRAKDVVSQESSLVVDIARDLEAALTVHDSVLHEVQGYAELVVNTEWPNMKQGAPPDTANRRGFGPGWSALARAYDMVLRSDTSKSAHPVVAEELVRRFNSLFDARRQRITYSTHGSLNGTIWGVVLAGGMLSIVCCWLLGYESRRMHVAGTTVVAASFALMFFLIISLEWPFRGPNQIPADQFCSAISNIHRQENNERRRHQEGPLPDLPKCPRS